MSDSFKHAYADVGDVRLPYVTMGQGPPVVLLHGWPQTCGETSSPDWQRATASLLPIFAVSAIRPGRPTVTIRKRSPTTSGVWSRCPAGAVAVRGWPRLGRTDRVRLGRSTP